MESSKGSLSYLSREKINNESCGASNKNVTCDNLVGGHINQIQIESNDVIVKKTSLNEVQQYQIIFAD
jgi:hypothetical protein